MKAIVLRHHDEDNPGLIGLELERRGFTLTIHRMPEDGPPPNPRDYDLCIVLGAKWSLVDRVGIETWIDQELDWLRTADAAGVPVLGICFGSQALAAAHGGRVTTPNLSDSNLSNGLTKRVWLSSETSASIPNSCSARPMIALTLQSKTCASLWTLPSGWQVSRQQRPDDPSTLARSSEST